VSTDPEFVPKAADIIGLYLHPPEILPTRRLKLLSPCIPTFARPSAVKSVKEFIEQLISEQMAADAPYAVVGDALPIDQTVREFLPTILGTLQPLV